MEGVEGGYGWMLQSATRHVGVCVTLGPPLVGALGGVCGRADWVGVVAGCGVVRAGCDAGATVACVTGVATGVIAGGAAVVCGAGACAGV